MNLGDLTVRIRASLGNFQQNMMAARTSMRKLDDQARISSVGLLKSFQTFAKISTTLYVTKQALDHLLGPTIEIGRSFEEAMYKMKVAADLSGAEFEKASAHAKALGNDIRLPGVSAEDAAIAMMEMARAGMDLNSTMAAAPGVLSMATLGEMDVGEAAKMSAKLLNTFNLEGDRATDIANYLGRAAQKSSAELDELVYGMSSGSAVWDMTNQSVEDLIISLAMLSDNMVEGEEAGTALKTMMMRLIEPAGDGAALMKKYGIEVRNLATGEFKSMPELVDEFTTKLDGLTAAEKDSTLATIFGTKAIKGAHLILANGRGAYDEYAAAILEGKDAQQMLFDQMPPFEKALERVKNTVANWQIDFWQNYLGPGFTAAMEGTMDFIDDLGKLKENLEKGVDFGDSWVGVWGEDAVQSEIVRALDDWIDRLQWLGDKFDWVDDIAVDAWDAISGAADDCEHTVEIAVGAILGWLTLMTTRFLIRTIIIIGSWIAQSVAAWASAILQIGRIILLIAWWGILAVTALVQGAVVVAMYLLMGRTALVSSLMQAGALGRVGKAFKSLSAIITSSAIWTFFFGKKTPNYGKLAPPAKTPGLWGRLVPILTMVNTRLGLIGVGITGFIAAFYLANKAVDWLTDKIGFLATGAIPRLLSMIPGLNIFGMFMEQVWKVKAIGKAIPAIAGFAKRLPGLLWGAIKGIGKAFAALPGIIGGAIKGLVKEIPGLFASFISNLSEFLWQGFLTAIEYAVYAFFLLPGLMWQALPYVLNAGVWVGEQIWNGFKSAPGFIANGISWLFQTLWNGITGFVGFNLQIGWTILTWIFQGFMSLPGAVVSGVSWLATTLWDGLVGISKFIVTNGLDVLLWLIEGFTSDPSRLWDAIVAIKDFLVDGVVKAKDAFVDIGKDIIFGIWDGLKKVDEWLGDKWEELKNAVVKGIKKAFGAESPATEMIPVGIDIAWGIMKGILETAGGMTTVLKDVFGGAVEAAWHFISKGWASVADFPGLVAGGLGSLFSGTKSLEKGIAFAMSKVGLPYVWGGGHGGDLYNVGGYDCSGFVSAVLNSMGIPMQGTTYTLYDAMVNAGWVRGDGPLTVGFYGDLSHVGIGMLGKWFESGGGYGGVAQSSGSNFPIHLTPFLVPPGADMSMFGYGRGGLARTPQIATIAERNPEYVLPASVVDTFIEAEKRSKAEGAKEINIVLPNVTNYQSFKREYERDIRLNYG